MASKAKIRQKQDEREIKLFHEIISGKAKVANATYERPKKPSQANRVGGAAGDETKGKLTESYIRLLSFILPGILAELSQIDDPRDQIKITHSLPALILYGILMFLSHTSSRRAANREIGGSELLEMVKEFVPDFLRMPHADTLERLLKGIDVNELEKKYEGFVVEFIKSDQIRTLNPGRFLVAIDGTQKFSRQRCWDERALSKNAGDPEKERYYVYMMESVLILENGMVLPLLTETLENGESLDDNGKQDCELKAFKRLAGRLEKILGKGCVTIVADGLYASGPVVSICNNYNWEFMISLKKDCLKSVWENFDGLKKIEVNNQLNVMWGERAQEYIWSNGLEYTYGNNHKLLNLNVVTCTETWHEQHPRKGGKPRWYISEYAWLSSQKIKSENVFKLCEMARSRWKIENYFYVVKNNGYQYEHCFSYDWNAMKGYHFLMKFANFINTFILSSHLVCGYVVAEGKKGFIKKIWGYLFEHNVTEIINVKSIVGRFSLNYRYRNIFRKLELKTA